MFLKYFLEEPIFFYLTADTKFFLCNVSNFLENMDLSSPTYQSNIWTLLHDVSLSNGKHVVFCWHLIVDIESQSIFQTTELTCSTADLYKIFGSKKMQGFLSLMQDKSKPLAMDGLLGMTILRPGVWAKYDSGDWEWYKAPWPTAPQVARNVREPQSNRLPLLYLYLAASFTIYKYFKWHTFLFEMLKLPDQKRGKYNLQIVSLRWH